jgi:transcriptional regulator with XRE-family HTH domain
MTMTSNGNDETGGALRTRRQAAGLTQQQLAELAHCSVSIVGLLERGLRPGHSDVLLRIEHVLNTSESPAGKPSSRDNSGVEAAGHVVPEE